ncbi:hypothetical protein ABTG41_04575 [Acinetobacter baumannii]
MGSVEWQSEQWSCTKIVQVVDNVATVLVDPKQNILSNTRPICLPPQFARQTRGGKHCCNTILYP